MTTRLKAPYYLGIDPGKSGALALVDCDGFAAGHYPLSATERDVWDWIVARAPTINAAVLERVHAFPGQGRTSIFTFGASYGFCRALLVAAELRFELASPAKWQRALGCRSKGDKRVTKAKAQELFPNVAITHAVADAYLLAEYARRMWCAQ